MVNNHLHQYQTKRTITFHLNLWNIQEIMAYDVGNSVAVLIETSAKM